MSILIYGATGYTGALTVERAVAHGLRPVLAGRNADKLRPLAERHGLEFRAFRLDEAPGEIARQLAGVALVLHCAGPFSRTARPMVEACLAAGVHYLDITGEIDVFERVKSYHRQAAERGVILLSGTGFDVVPTDCMAAWLHRQLPDATHLELAFTSLSSISHGTMTTLLENLGHPGAARRDGRIVAEPVGRHGLWIDFGRRRQFCMSIPWGDVSTAHHTTGIPNIRTYTGVPPVFYRLMKLQALINPLLRTTFVRRRLQRYVDARITGPTPEQLARGRSFVWGRVRNAAGQSVEGRLECAEAYWLTAEMSLHIAGKILADSGLAPGYHTPAGLFGYGLIQEIPGTKFEV